MNVRTGGVVGVVVAELFALLALGILLAGVAEERAGAADGVPDFVEAEAVAGFAEDGEPVRNLVLQTEAERGVERRPADPIDGIAGGEQRAQATECVRHDNRGAVIYEVE